MHHLIKKTVYTAIITAAAAAVISACAPKAPAHIEIETSQYETDTASVYAETPVFSFMENKELETALNSEYEKDIQGRMVEFDTGGSDEPLAGGNKRVLEILQDIPYNSGRFISVVSETYDYEGGAHGQTVRTAKNVDVQSGTVLKLSDLFTDDTYVDELNRLIMEAVENHPEEYSDLWEKPVIKESNQTDFYLSEDGLIIFYQPYDLSYYARGFVNFTIYPEDISGYLKEEYRAELIGKKE